jgi:hypothetical protein
MGIKRFLVAGGMAGLVLIGVLLVNDTKGLAKNSTSRTNVAGQCQNNPMCSQAVGQATGVGYGNAQNAAQTAHKRIQKANPQIQMGTRGTEETARPTTGEQPGVGSGNSRPPQGEIAGIGMSNNMGMGDQQAPSGGTEGGGSGGAGGGGGAGGALVTFTNLPHTGGLPVVLLLTSAFLLGSGLLMVAIVRSVRS